MVTGCDISESQRVSDPAQLPAATRIIYVSFSGEYGIMAQPRARYE